jgi:hypothetical protein
VVRALYQHDPQRATSELADARAGLDSMELGEDEAIAAGYLLDNLAYTIVKARGGDAEKQQAYGRLQEKLSEQAPGGVAQVVRRILLLQLRIYGERAGYGGLSPEEFHALFDFIPADSRDLELWHNVASWAFEHEDSELMDEAYEVFVIQPSGFVSQYPFHRVKLMHAVLEGRVTTQEVDDFLARLVTPNEIREFKNHILPRIEAEESEDVDMEAVRQCIKQAELRISTAPPTSP